MIGFWFVAVGLLAGALSFVVTPIWHFRQQNGNWSAAGIIAAVALVPIALSVYLSVTTWNLEAPLSDELPAISDVVEQLADRLRENPDDVTGWLMLGRSYFTTGRYPEALTAFREAWDRTPVPGVELKGSIAEVEVLIDPLSLNGSAGRLFDEVLDEDPMNERALWYAGLGALQKGQIEIVRQRWSALLTIGVPEQMAQAIQEQLDALPETSGTVSQSTSSPENFGFAIHLNVTFGDSIVAADMPGQASLFVFARAAEGGPPLAVIRALGTSVPGVFVLTDANAMIPGRSLADFEALSLVARISFSGQPIAQSGDLFGEFEYRRSESTGVVELVINQIVP